MPQPNSVADADSLGAADPRQSLPRDKAGGILNERDGEMVGDGEQTERRAELFGEAGTVYLAARTDIVFIHLD